ncbi:peptidase inhibitor family I36 protein [Streptomyces sp. NRRL B-24484]|uniref:peptidase inhibitor family I36 protein n=1 Tax=Streptomyces sp. NRRL B-24484 TaxID=1463833 RepID=UPI0005BC603B|nr:peptidase inhibitor family I36 protein [Streptomyces sp. NRRL B-24484]
MKRSLKLSAVALGAALLVPGLATAAQADTRDCPEVEFCLFYNSNQQGSHMVVQDSTPDLAGYTFTSPGNGRGQRVKNNAASAVSNVCVTVTVFYNSNYSGPSDMFNYRNAKNLVNTYNENASVKFARDC